ncbi:tripartite tricarboxylate transporter substrate binding protein [Halanaerobiaceae bacterium Z-7014]|uniref:Tripartite tricarboxylate transporter substrate binding protein n=1 Tax=Halonatronomonas betaini TaxID=2778430 RepID=A0A931AUE0_9FIRM|nr:tripartite tricarboxylate transporter substrate binding protein [Halonatronomonas betaini]MBF8436854.1 tripartite tricarboxylate transporter substrate binding protein [Halonatronomonas betaini]
MSKNTRYLIIILVFSLVFSFNNIQAEEPWSAVEGESFDLIVGFDSGGSHDLSARYLAEALSDLNIDINIVNMPGGIGTEAGYHVASQDPDSNILFWGHPPAVVFDPATENVGYEYSDFDPVGAIGSPTFVIASRDGAPYETLDELIEYMEENPGEVIVGGQGEMHLMHFAIEFILPMDELDYRYVALAGGADVTLNLTGGHVDVGHMSLSAARPLHEDDDLTVMVHTSSETEEVDMMPDVPHVSEYGIEFTEPHTMAAWAPAGTDLETREALNAAFAEVLENDEELQSNMSEMGFILDHYTIEETDDYFGGVLYEEILPQYEEWLENQRQQ